MSKPSWTSQLNDWQLDLMADAEASEKQAETGPFYPERDITPTSLRAYAATCRAQAAKPEQSLREALRGTDPFGGLGR